MSTAGNHKVLLLVGVNSFFYHQMSLALLLKKQSIGVMLMFDLYYPTIHYDLALCKKHDLPYLLTYKYREDDKKARGFLGKLGTLLEKIEYRFFSRFFREYIRSVRVLSETKKILTGNDIRIVVMVADLVHHDTGIYIKAAHASGAKVMIIPLFAANYKEAAQHYYNDPKVQITKKTYDRLKQNRRVSKWVIHFREKYMIRLPLSYVYVREMMGTSPVNPWSVNTGDFDIMAVEGRAVKKLFTSSNDYNEERIVVMGSLSTDKIYHNLRQKSEMRDKLIAEYGLDPAKKNLLVAIPPDMFSSRSSEMEFDSYNSFVHFWIKHISQLSAYNILYTIHPSVDKKDHTFFTDLGCKIIQGPTIDFISLFDLYIASVSATIQWATQSGIPVINHDIYNYDYDDYKGVSGVVYAANNAEFVAVIEKFKDVSVLEAFTSLQKQNALEWGELDGKGGERIVQYIKEQVCA